jgi:AcrR family transcriptional regulator
VEDADLAAVVRRAPFADSPFVGQRGHQARQRIVDAALQLFGELGYHECGIKRITELSGCSRAAFYQYFSGKEDLFRQLTGQVARQLADLTDGVGSITPDPAGYDALRSWLDGYRALYVRYAPVFLAFQSAAVSDEAVASGGARVAVRTFDSLRSKLDGVELPARQADGVTRALPEVTARACALTDLMAAAGMGGDLFDGDRIHRAVADVFHRALFAPDPAVNVHPPAGGEPSSVPEADVTAAFADRELAGPPSLGPTSARTRDSLLDAGHRVFTERGYYAARVADVVELAGLSRGIFYRYFENKTHLFRLLAEQASTRFLASLAAVPALVDDDGRPIGPDELRSWLRDYAATTLGEAAIRARWNEALSRDPTLRNVSAALTERYRASCAALLTRRTFGDHDAEAVVLVLLLDGMAIPRLTDRRIETTARIIGRGLLAAP